MSCDAYLARPPEHVTLSVPSSSRSRQTLPLSFIRDGTHARWGSPQRQAKSTVCPSLRSRWWHRRLCRASTSLRRIYPLAHPAYSLHRQRPSSPPWTESRSSSRPPTPSSRNMQVRPPVSFIHIHIRVPIHARRNMERSVQGRNTNLHRGWCPRPLTRALCYSPPYLSLCRPQVQDL